MLKRGPGCHRPAIFPVTVLARARPGSAQPPRLPEPLTVKRRVSVRGAIMIGGQKIQVGLTHARKTAKITVGADTYQITVEDGITLTPPHHQPRHPAAQSLQLQPIRL